MQNTEQKIESAAEEDIDRSRFLLSQKSMRAAEPGHLDPETRARLRALLESTGLSKLTSAESKALADPEVLRRLTDKVSSAMDEAASTLMRIKAEQHKNSAAVTASSGHDSPCAHSSSDIDAVDMPPEDSQSCPDGIDQALQGDSLLLMACSAGYYELAQVLLALKSDVEDRGSKGDRTPLMEAASGGYLDIVRLLIAHKANVNAQAASGNTALHYAASGGHVNIARELIIAGARVEEPNENGHTPLMEAATAGQVEVASLLLSRGANINTHSTEFKESALTLACYKGHLEMVKFLLEKGADLEHKTDEMHTALMEASMDGHVDVARLLLDHGAQVNMPADSFESPLTLAACGGHTELAALLIDRGANLEEVNDEGYTPLMEAVREGHEEMVTLLLNRGADANAQTEETQETALTLACCGGFLEIAELLLAWKANMELGCSTPLMEAAQEGHVRLVEYLIKAGANVNAQTFTKGTALTYACENGHTDIAEILIKHGAELDHESEGGRTALMRASKNGHLSTVKFLVSKGACINKTTTANDHTVLSVACANGHQQVVDFLLKSGADVSHKLKDGSTMLIEAAKGGQFDIMNLLLDWPSSGNAGSLIAPLPSVCDQLNKEKAVVRDELANANSPIAARAKDTLDTGSSAKSAKPLPALPSAQAGVNVSGESAGGTPLSATSDLAELPDDQLWEAFFGKMANKGDVPGLGREEQIVVKQQMLDRLMQLERELQERSLLQARGKANDDSVAAGGLLDGGTTSSSQNRNRFMVVNDRLRGDEELAIAILEKAVLGETVLDQVMLEQLKAYIRGGAGDAGNQGDGSTIGDVMRNFDIVHESFEGAGGDFACEDFDNSSVGSGISSEEGEKFEDACSDDAGQYMVEGDGTVPQLDRLEKHMTPQLRRTVDQQELIATATGDESSAVSSSKQQVRTSAEGVDAAVLAKTKDHFGTKGSRRVKIPLPYGDSPASVPVAGKLAAAAGKTGASQSVHLSELERNLTLQQQRQHLQTQLVLQQQLHDELQQHLRLQQEHQQLQAQLKVKEVTRGSGGDGSVVTVAPSSLSSQAQALLSPLDHQCCRHQQPCPQQRHHVQQQLLQLQHQLQQAAGHTNNDSLHQAQQQALKLAQMHQKRNSLQVNVPPQMVPGANNLTTGGIGRGNGTSVTQCTQTGVAPAIDLTTKNVNTGPVPVTGNAATLAAQKKAADTSSMNHVNVAAHNVPTHVSGDANRPVAAARQLAPGTGSQPRAKVLPPAPCPNCCTDAKVPARQASATSGGNTTAQTQIDVDAQTDSNHDTALTLAAAGGHTRLVVLLLARGANVEHRDKKGLTPLILAAAAGHHEVCEVLLNNKADIEAQSEKNKDTALSLACANGRLEVVNMLLSKGANKEHRNISDYTPLSQAASGGYVNVIRALLSHGAEINSRTGSKMGISPLMLAAMNGHTAAVKLLLDMGSDINAQIETNRNTALTLACFQGRYEVVSLLIDRKANIEHRAKTGLTPLMEAASGGYVEVGRVLLDKGADIAAAPVPVSRDTALTIAADKGHHRFVELLLSRGAAVDVRNKKGNTPLWLACNGGHVECVQLLVAAGADVHAEDNRHVSCIMAAFRKAHIKVVKVLVRHVTQFPPDQDCLRYITTLTDKDLVKRCHQCMTLIVSAKEQQAAEANKNAAILLEELSMEREREETKRAAAARKRDKKKLKKKVRTDRGPDPDGMSSEMMNGDSLEVDDAELDDPVIPYKTNPICSSLPVTSSNSCPSPEKKDCGSLEEIVSAETSLPKASSKAQSPLCNINSSESSQSPAASDTRRRSNRHSRHDRQKPSGDLVNSIASVTADNAVPMPSSASSLPTYTNTAIDKVTINGDVRNYENTPFPLSVAPTPSQYATLKDPLKEQNLINVKQALLGKPLATTNSATGIGDLDDFGSLSIGTSFSQTSKSNAVKKPAVEKPVVLVEAKSSVSSKKPTSTQNNKAGSKKARKDDDWEEVTRKSKRLLVKASVISRVIGRGGCNINAIRDISTAQVEIDRSRDATTERIITIKGSVEATKYAQELIEKLINDEDKKFEHMLPTMKPLTPSRSSHAGQKQKQSAGSGSGSKVSLATAVNGTLPPKDDPLKSSVGKLIAPVSMPSAWAQPSAAVLQSKPKSSVTASNSDPSTSAWNSNSTLRISPETSRLSYSDWTRAVLTSTLADSAGSWSPPVDKMATGVSGTGSTASTTSCSVRPEPVPLPIVATSTASHPGTLVVRPAAVATTIVRDYSPFDNMLSQITESVLAKRPADDFASVAAAGVIVTSAQHSVALTFADESIVFQTPIASIAADPNLMAKAPGYRPHASADPAKAPGHRVSRDAMSTPYGTRGCITTSASSTDSTTFQPHEFGRPSSTPTVAVSLVEDISLVGRALGSSLDRPSLYSGAGIYPNCPGLGFAQHGSLPPFGGNVPSLEAFASTFQPGGGGDVNVPALQQVFGAHCSLGNAVNETSVLGAPLMTTSIAPGPVMPQGHLPFDDRFGVAVTSASSTSADSAALVDEGHGEIPTGQSPVAAEPHGHNHNHASSLDDHRKPLGPIGTERASRRPAATPSHQPEFPFNNSGNASSMWALTAEADWNGSLPPLFSTLADHSAALLAAGLHVDNGSSLPHHSVDFPMGYHDFTGADANAVMISDMYSMDPSMVDQSAMQHMLQAGHPAMLMHLPGDMQTSYNGMLGHVPPPSFQQMCPSGFMMAPDGTNHLWGLSQMSAGSSADVPYLGPKGSQMMWNQNWTPSANM